MKPENPTKKQSLSVEQMVTDAAHIRATLLERLVAAVSDVETERLEKLNELSTRCKEAYQLLDELVDQQNAGRLVRDSAFKFAYDNIKSASDDVDAFLNQITEQGNPMIEKTSDVAEKSDEKYLNESTSSPETVPANGENDTNSVTTTKMVQNIEHEVKQPVSAKPAPSRKPPKLQDQHVKERLVIQLFDNESHDFLLTDAPEGQKRRKKKVMDLKDDIALVFAAKGVSGKTATEFFNTKFAVQHEEIRNLSRLAETEKDKQKVDEYRNRINTAYEQIREDTIAEVMTVMAERDERSIAKEDSPLQRDIESIRDDIDTARFFLEELRDRHESIDGFLNSDEYKKVENIFELIKNCKDADSNVLNHKLEKYLTALWPALNELTNKFTVGAGDETNELKLNERKATVPETPDQGLSIDKETILKEFEELQNIPNDSPLRDSEEFKRAVRGFEIVQQYKNHEKPEIREKVFDIFKRHVEALQKKAGELEAQPAAATKSGEANQGATPDVDLEQQQVQEFLNGVEVTELDEIPKVTESTNLIDPARLVERKEQGKNSLEAKNVFRRTEKKYKEALEIHQQEINNQGMFAKMRSLGMKPELPESIKALEAEYQALRKVYARELDARLSQRGEKYELSQDDMKRAFARKFILKPHEELIKLQEYNLLKPEARARLQSIAGKMAKHKWGIRAGVITLAGVVGFATGGTALAFAGAAGERGARMLGSAVFGAYAGGIAHDRAEEYVEQKRNELENTKSSIERNFSIDSMFDSAGNLTKAAEAEAKARKIQKVAGVVAGGIAGFAAGAGSVEAGTSVTESALDKYDAALRDAQTEGVAPVSNGLNEGDLSKLETAKIVPQVVESADVPPQPAFIEKVALPFDSREGGLVYEHHVNDISFGSEFKPAALTDADTKALNSFIRVKLDDILVNPYTPVPDIETRLQAAIEKSFGDSQWWKDSPVTTVDIGKVEVVLVSGTETTPEIVNGEYIVEKGDTLWGIAKEKFADQLKDLTPQERNEVLGRLFERVKADSGLMESLSLDSVNNIDLIKTGESIELGGLQAELTQVLEDREIVEEFRKSAPLPVEADSGVKSVPISVVEKPIPGGTEVVINNERSYTEAAPTKPVITPEVTTSTKSFYETAPQQMRDEIRQVFGNPKAFDVAVERASERVTARAYDFFDTFSNSYENPYNLFRDMRISDYAKYQEMPNSQLRAMLTDQKIKYEAFLEWEEKIKELQKNIPHNKADTIGKMFEQSVLMDKIAEKDNSYINP